VVRKMGSTTRIGKREIPVILEITWANAEIVFN